MAGSLTEALNGHRRIALDTSLWIYHLEEDPVFGRLASVVLRAVEEGRCRAVASEITLLELLVQPLRLGLTDVADEYEALLENFPHFQLAPVTRPVTLKAAALRAQHALRTPDALIVATGLVHGATLVVTNDDNWKRVEGVKILCLRDFTSPR